MERLKQALSWPKGGSRYHGLWHMAPPRRDGLACGRPCLWTAQAHPLARSHSICLWHWQDCSPQSSTCSARCYKQYPFWAYVQGPSRGLHGGVYCMIFIFSFIVGLQCSINFLPYSKVTQSLSLSDTHIRHPFYHIRRKSISRAH